MATSVYNFVTDFTSLVGPSPYGPDLEQEIRDSGSVELVQEFQYTEFTPGGAPTDCTVTTGAVLTAPAQGALDAVIAAHVGFAVNPAPPAGPGEPDGIATLDSGGQIPSSQVPDGSDATAVHVDAAAEVSALALVSAAAGDHILIEDASDADNKKRVDANDFLPVPAIYVDFFNAAAFSGITTVAATLPLNTTRQSDPAFTLAANEVTVNTGGDYRVDFGAATQDLSGGDATIDVWLEVNTLEVTGTRTRMFHDSASEEGSCHAAALLTLSAADTVRVQAQVVSGAGIIDTLAGGVRLMLHSIGANGANGAAGAPGPQGPAGSGSSVGVQEEGVNLPSTPHTAFNFVGAGVVAADAGAGIASVTVPGGSPEVFSAAHTVVLSNIPETFQDVSMDTELAKTAGFTHTAGSAEVVANFNGRVEIGGHVTVFADVATNNRAAYEARLQVDTGGGYTTVPGTSVSGYIKDTLSQTNNKTTATITPMIVSVSVGDTFKLQVAKNDGTGNDGNLDTVADSAALTIKAI